MGRIRLEPANLCTTQVRRWRSHQLSHEIVKSNRPEGQPSLTTSFSILTHKLAGISKPSDRDCDVCRLFRVPLELSAKLRAQWRMSHKQRYLPFSSFVLSFSYKGLHWTRKCLSLKIYNIDNFFVQKSLVQPERFG